MVKTDNWFVVGDEMLTHLRQELMSEDSTKKLHLLSAADLADVTEEKQLTPAVHVIPLRHAPMKVGGGGKSVMLEQVWLAVIAVRNVRSVGSGDAARGESGLLAMRVFNALQGWKPSSAAAPLNLTTGPNFKFIGGFQYVPLAFTTELAVGQTRESR